MISMSIVSILSIIVVTFERCTAVQFSDNDYHKTDESQCLGDSGHSQARPPYSPGESKKPLCSTDHAADDNWQQEII